MEGYGGVKCVERGVVKTREMKTQMLHLNTKKKELRSERSEARTNLPLTSTRSTRLDCS